jgi:hypothetical protein
MMAAPPPGVVFRVAAIGGFAPGAASQ